jgi:uncharacterized protein with HEPN domain
MKTERDIRLYLDDILEAIGKIEKYTEGLDYEQFRKDEKTGDIEKIYRKFQTSSVLLLFAICF